MSTQMTREEREAFLADLHVGVLGLNEPGRGPLAVPVWYRYQSGGEVVFLTGPSSRKGKLIAVGSRVSLCAQSEAVPYQYVSIEGPVLSVEPSDLERDLRPMARRYLGDARGDRYTEQSANDGSVVVRVRPERWLTVDYAKAS